MKKIALIDGYGFVFRAYHSLPPLTRADGTPVGAVYGFTNMLIKLLAGLDVSHVAVVFDAGSKTFRNDIYEDYKANRPPCPEDLKPQFPIVREAAESLNLAILEKAGVEADDIIATLAKQYDKKDYQVVIVSSDKDLMQLINENVSMYDAMKNRNIGAEQVFEKFSVKPDQVLDVLSLMGDSADNVPGVRGIGPKTAAELINEFGDLEGIFANLDKIKQKKRKEYLENGQGNALLSRKLITLKDDVEIGLTEDDLALQDIDPHKLIKFLSEQDFRSLTQRVKKDFGVADDEVSSISRAAIEKSGKKTEDVLGFKNIKQLAIKSNQDLDLLLEKIYYNGQVIIDFDYFNEDLNAISFSSTKSDVIEQVVYLDLTKINGQQGQSGGDLFSQNTQDDTLEIDFSYFTDKMQQLLADDSVKKIFFDAKRFLRLFYFTINKEKNRIATKFGDIKAIEDVSLIHHLLHSDIKNDFLHITNLSLDENFESKNYIDIYNDLKKGKEIEKFTEEEAVKLDYYCFRNYSLYRLFKFLHPQLIKLRLVNSYYSYELPMLPLLAQIENIGVKIDINKLGKLSKEFEEKISLLTKEIYEISGSEFNIASKKSKKTGALSTKSSVLEELSEQGHEIADKILEFRKLSKLVNTYTEALPKEINDQTDRVHTSLSTISTITGRLSSSNPNLQNIPIRSPEGKKIRQCFIPEKGNLLICADYSQVELRVIAHVAKIKSLINAFAEDKDIHAITAAEVFGLEEDQVTSDHRSSAKAINFGIVYGISAFGLAKQLKIPRNEAGEYIANYLATYPGIDKFMKDYQDFASKHGYIETISGRKCFIDTINDKNHMVKAEAQRLAINAPIQGSAADIIKVAMVKLNERLNQENIAAKIILQIHDELIIETSEENSEKVSKIVKEEMEKAMILDVVLKVDIEVGTSWG